MENITNALSDFTKAQAVIAWLKENGLLKDDAGEVGSLAFDYAIRYASPATIDAFRYVAKTAVKHRDDAASDRKRTRGLSSDAAEQAHLEQMRIAHEVATEARSFAIIVADKV